MEVDFQYHKELWLQRLREEQEQQAKTEQGILF